MNEHGFVMSEAQVQMALEGQPFEDIYRACARCGEDHRSHRHLSDEGLQVSEDKLIVTRG